MKHIISGVALLAISVLCEAQPWMNIHDNDGNVYSLDVQNVEYIDFGDYVESSFSDYETIAQKYFLLTKNKIPSLDSTLAEIGEVTGKSAIQGRLYPATKDNKCKEVSDLFRYSLPMRVDTTSTYSKFGVRPTVPRRRSMTIEFYADCNRLEIKGYHGFQCIVVVDGVRINSSNNENFTKSVSSVFSFLPISFAEKRKRLVKIYYWGLAGFAGIVTDGEITRYRKKRLLLCADGDSVVEGLGGAREICSNWVGLIGQYFDFDIYNAAIGGSGFVQTGNYDYPNMPDRFDEHIAKYTPDILMFSGGFNDKNADEEFVENVDEYFRKATNLNHCRIIACSPYCNVDLATAPERLQQQCEIIRKKALEYHIPFIDYMHAMTYDSEGNCITNNLGTEAYHNIITEENRATYLDLESGDTVHPNATGHAAIGKYIACELYKVLNRLEGF